MKRALALLLSLSPVPWSLSPTPCHAAMLLAEFEFTQPDSITLPAIYNFGVYADTNAGWVRTVDAFDTTDHADPELLAHFNRLTNTLERGVRFQMSNGGQGMNQFGSAPFDWIWFPDGDPNDGVTATAFVPKPVGPDGTERWALWGYTLTDVERVITADAQTVRFYGVVPEPASWLLVLLAGVLHLSIRCRV